MPTIHSHLNKFNPFLTGHLRKGESTSLFICMLKELETFSVCLYIYGLFKDAVCVWDCKVSDGGIISKK
jgi:hypothetical protein